MLESSIFIGEGKKVKVLCGEELHVVPLVIKTRAKIISLLSEIISKLVIDSAGKTNVSSLSEILNIAGDKLIEIYEVSIEGKEREWLENNITLKDEVVLLEAIFEVNEINFLSEKVKAIFLKQTQP